MAINRKTSARGFTLIEVMVALVVVALALPALLTLVMNQLDGTAMIREKTKAFWVAENQLTRLRLQDSLIPGFTPPQSSNGEVDLAGEAWFWRIDMEDSGTPNLPRVVVSVARASEREEVVASLSGFIYEP